MNLYVIGWNLPNESQLTVLNEIRRMTEVYPHLDPETLWHSSNSDGTVFTASMHTAKQVAAPRQYVIQNEDRVVFYSGLPVNPTGEYKAHDAADLARHWGQLTETLEGMYFIARATYDPLVLEVQTDILGFEQAFYVNQGKMWLLSNSVRLIEYLTKSRDLDPLGVSLFLSMHWVGSDCTLRSGIRVIPGGQRWRWQAGDIEPKRKSYYSPAKLACHSRKTLTPSFQKRLAEDLMQPLSNLGQNFKNDISCPLTGGRDSRLIAALLSRAGVPAAFFTIGEPTGGDAKIAMSVAQVLDLPYEVKETLTSDVIRDWAQASWDIIRQCDGMRPLHLMASPATFLDAKVDHLNIRLSGAGGEIARGYYYKPYLFMGRPSIKDIQRLLANRITNHRGLIRPRAVNLARDYIIRFVEQRLEDGFAPIDVPDIFYAYQRVGQRAGKNLRMSMSIRDSYSPFCTRPFIEATFALSPIQRYTEPLHFTLTRYLSPKLHSLPFVTNPWRTQQPMLNLLKAYSRYQSNKAFSRIKKRLNKSTKKESSVHVLSDTMFDRTGWFESKREQIREICLDQVDSVLWDFVDRSVFERITSSDTDSVYRSHYLVGLYFITTLFYYETDHQQNLVLN